MRNSMAENSELQKTISFRLNIKRAEEKALYEAIMSHNRGKTDDPYGSGGAYIKAALKSFYGNEEQVLQQDHYHREIQKMMQEQMDTQSELILKTLRSHDSKLVNKMVETVVNALADRNVVSAEPIKNTSTAVVSKKVEEFKPISEPEETMPEEAFSYLQNL